METLTGQTYIFHCMMYIFNKQSIRSQQAGSECRIAKNDRAVAKNVSAKFQCVRLS